MAVQINVAANQAALVQSINAGIQAYNQKFASQNQINLGINARSFSQPLGRITGDVKDFEAALAASNARVIAFGASTAVLGGVLRSFKAIAQVTIDVEKNLTDINRVFGLSTQELQKFSAELFNVSKMTASSFKDASQAALEFSRQGVKAEEVIQRTTDALSLARLAGMNVSNAIEALTATVNGFKNTGITTTQVLNKLVAVEQSYAVSAGDLAEALSRTGLAAQEAGVNIDELNALVTAAQEKTARGGAVIGNALKTIFTRLQRTETLDQLEDFNIKVRDMQGNILPAVTILKNFASAYKGLADSQRAQLSEQVAGVYQVNILKSIISDLDGAQSAYNGALRKGAEASNEAEMAVAKLNLSLDALLSQTSTVAQQFAANIGKVTFEPLAKYAVGKFKSLFETLNETLEGEGLGSTFANGLLKGIRNVLAGPGAVLAFFTLFKLIQKSFGQLTAAIPQIIGITTETQNRKNLEQAILKIMQSQSDAAKVLEGHMGNEAAQAKYLLEIARAQTAEYERQSALAKSLASQLSYQGATVVGETAGGGLRVTRSGGYVPPVKQEVMGAKALGANSGVKAVSGIGKIGGKNFIANNQEIQIPNFAGSGETAVIPKYGGGMSKAIQMISSGKSGSILSRGYVPNFAEEKKKADRTATRDEMRSILSNYNSVEEALQAYSSPTSPKTAYWKIGEQLVSASSAQLQNAFIKSNLQFGGYDKLFIDGGPESTADKTGKTFEKIALGVLQPNTFSAQSNSFPFNLNIPGGPNSSVDFFNPVSKLFYEAKSGGFDTGPVRNKFLRVRSELVQNLDEQLRGWNNILLVNSHGKTKEELKNTGYIPNFANPRIVGKGSNLFVSSLYDSLSGEYGGGPEYPFVRPGLGAAFLNKSKTTDMINLIKPFIESGSRVIFGAQAGTVKGDLGLIKGLAGNKLIIDVLKEYYPKLANKFIQEGTSTEDLTGLFNKFYKTIGVKNIRERILPFVEPDILDFYKKNPEFGASISRLVELGPESLMQAASSQHSLYPAAIAGKGLKRMNPLNAQNLFGLAGKLSKDEVLKLFGTVRVAKLPIGFRWNEGDEASKMLGLSDGFLPNFAPFNIKRGVGFHGDQHVLSLPSGSDMQYKYEKDKKLLNIKYVESKEKGEGWKLWARAVKMARRLKSNIASSVILAQERDLYKLDKDTADFHSIIRTAYPQLNYRERGEGKNTSLTLTRYLSQGGSLEKNISGKRILQKVVNASEYMYKGDSATLYDEIIDSTFEISNLLDTVNRGFLPNFAKYRVVRTKDKGQRRRSRAITSDESGSSLLYSYISSNRVRGPHLDFDFINSYKTGEGHEMFDRYSKMARRLGVKSYSSMLLPQEKLQNIIPKDEYDSLSEFHQRHKYILENMTIRDILKMAFPQLIYRQKGLTKNSDVTYTIERAGLINEQLKGKDVFSSLVSAVKPYYDETNPIDMMHLRDELLRRDTRVDDIVDEFAQGYLPNFANYRIARNTPRGTGDKQDREIVSNNRSSLRYFYVPEDEKKGPHFKLDFIHSLKSGEGHEMFSRYSKMARRMGVKSYSSVILPQKSLRYITTRSEYENLREDEKKIYSVVEDLSLKDILKMAFPQLIYRERGISKNTSIKYKSSRKQPFTYFDLSGKNIFTKLLDELSLNYGDSNEEKQTFARDIYAGKIGVYDLVDQFAKGYLPNFANGYLDQVMGLESNLSGSKPILDTTTGPFPFIRNSTQPNFASAVADHGGINQALNDSYNNQIAAGLVNDGYVPNFAKFNWSALNSYGKGETGVMDAKDENEVIERLKAKGYYPSRVVLNAEESKRQKDEVKRQREEAKKQRQQEKQARAKTGSTYAALRNNLTGSQLWERIMPTGGFADPNAAQVIQQGLPQNINLATAGSQLGMKEEVFDKLVKQLQDNIKEATKGIGRFGRVFGNQDVSLTRQAIESFRSNIEQEVIKPENLTDPSKGTSLQRIRAIEEKALSDLQEERKQAKAGRGSQFGTILAIAGPQIAGLLEQAAFGNKPRTDLTEKERMGQSLLSTGITAVSTGASLGSFFGLPGTIIGSIAGGLIGLADAATSASLSLEEIAQKSNERLQKLQDASQAGTGYVESLRNLQELIVSGASQDKIKIASDQVALSFTEIADVKLAAKLSAAGSDVEKLSEELQKYNIEVKKSQGLVNALANLKSSDNVFSRYFLGGQTTAQKGVKSPKIAAANLAQSFFGTKVEQDLFNSFSQKGQAFTATVEKLVKEAFPDLAVSSEDFRNEVQRLADLLGGSSSLQIEDALKDLYKLGADNKLVQNVRKAATESFNTIMRRIEQNILMTALLTERELGQRQSMLSIEKTLVEFRTSFAETMENFIQSNLPEGPLKTAYGKQAASAKYFRQLNQLEVSRLEFQLNQEKDRRTFEQKQTEDFNKEFKSTVLKSPSLGQLYEKQIFPQIQAGQLPLDVDAINQKLSEELNKRIQEAASQKGFLRTTIQGLDLNNPKDRESALQQLMQFTTPTLPNAPQISVPTRPSITNLNPTIAPGATAALPGITGQAATPLSASDSEAAIALIEAIRDLAIQSSVFENAATKDAFAKRMELFKQEKINNETALADAQKEFDIRQALEKRNAELILSTTSLQLEANQKILNNNLFLKRVTEQIGNGLKIANAKSEALILKFEALKEDFRIDYFKGLKEILDRRVGLDADILKQQRNIEDRTLLQDIQSKTLQIAVERENTKVTKDLTDVMRQILLKQIEKDLGPEDIKRINENPFYGMSQNELNRTQITQPFEVVNGVPIDRKAQKEEAQAIANNPEKLSLINQYKVVKQSMPQNNVGISPIQAAKGNAAVGRAATNSFYNTSDFINNYQKIQKENAKLSIPEQIQGQRTFLADQLNLAQAAGNTELAVTIQNLIDELDTRKEILEITRKQIDENIKERNSRDYEMITYGGRLKKGFGEMKKQSQEMSLLIAEELPVKFADGMTNALMDVAKGVKSIGDAFTDMIINIGQSIMQESIRALMFRAIGSAGGSISSLFQQGGVVKAQSGGFIRGQNGFVVPGSGTGDKIPALLEPNEYVVNSRAAQIIGHDNLDALNFGMLPRFATGGGIAMQPELALKGDQYDFTGQLLRDTGAKKKISFEDYTAYAFAEDEYFKKVREQAVEDEAKRVQSDYEGKMKQAQLVSSIVGMLGGISLSAGLSGVSLSKSEGGKGVVGKNTMSGRPASLRTFGQTGGSVTYAGIKGYQLGGVVGYQTGGSIPYGSRISDNMASTFNANTNILSNNAIRRYAMSPSSVNMMQAGGPSTSNTTNNSTNNNATNISINIDKSGRSVFGADTNSYEQQDIQFSKKMARELSQFMNVKFSDEQRYNGKLYKSPYT